MRSSTLILLLSVFLLGYSGGDPGEHNTSTSDTISVNQSKATQDSSNSAGNSESLPEIQFQREQSFGSTDEVIVGSIETFTVDDSGRVYLADRDQITIYVYNPDGSYNTSLGRQGKGPGEFGTVSPNTTMTIDSNQLYVTDEVGFFSTESSRLLTRRPVVFSHYEVVGSEQR